MKEKAEQFAALLEEYGYENALEFVMDKLVVLAQTKHISLLDAAWEYADQDEEQDTSYYQLFHTLIFIPPERLRQFDLQS